MWIKDAIEAAKTIRSIRKQGINDKLALVAEEELVDQRQWLAQRDYENQLMQQAIIGTTKYKSICEYCEENKTCTRQQHGHKGCAEWWLRFLTLEEIDQCNARARGDTCVEESDGR